MDELIDILTSEGKATGKSALKSEAHHHGWFHATAHIWFFTSDRKILLQNKPYNDHIEQTVIRLFGSRQYLDEARHYMNWNRLRYDIDKGNIFDLNGSKYSGIITLPSFIVNPQLVKNFLCIP